MKINFSGAGPILCFGGPYSNLQATQAMRRKAKLLGIPAHRVICTGDVVAYCANPNETCAELRDWGCHIIQGNCEEQLVARADDCGCGFTEGAACDLLSQKWYAFANNNLHSDHRAWMAVLPHRITFDIGGRSARVIHGGAAEISKFIFPSTPVADKIAEFDTAKTDILIAGHSGIPFAQRFGERVWFNPGVIGMPANDGTPDGWYGLIEQDDDDGLIFTTQRLNYDAQAAADTLRAAGSADPYAQALVSGLWPSLDILPAPERSATGKALEELRVLPGIHNAAP